MIKRLSVFVLVMAILVGCSSDDGDTSNEEIVGTWQISSLTVESTNDYNGDGSANPNLQEETQCSGDDQLVFNADGTGFIVLDTENILLDVDQLPDFSYEYTFMCSSTGANQISMTWTQEGNTITTVNFTGTRVYTLAGNTLTAVVNPGLEVPVIEDIGNGTFGVDYVFEEATYTYTKL